MKASLPRIPLWSRLSDRFLDPRMALRLRYAKHLVFGEPELRLLRSLVDKSRTAVDVGANLGVYTLPISRLARVCVAYEPNPFLAKRLSAALGNETAVKSLAISDSAGTTTLRAPIINGQEITGWGSITKAHSGLTIVERDVRTTRLDDESLGDVGFIKIDVEGAEARVLRGAQQLLHDCLPTLLIEIEERHSRSNAEEVLELLMAFGYHCFFCQGRSLRRIAKPTIERIEAHHRASGSKNLVFRAGR